MMTMNSPVVVDPADPTTWQEPQRGRCWFLGCSNEVPQTRGSGRAKSVCEQVVDGVKHTRLNKNLAQRGKRGVPAPGSGPATSPSTAGDVEHAEQVAKPVSTARQTYSQVLAHVQATLAGLPALVERLESAARTVADQEQTAAEIAAVERTERGKVDQAEAERDAALTQARVGQRQAETAQAAQAEAEEAAEQALEAEDLAGAERDEALAAKAAAEQAEQQQRQRADDAERELAAVRGELERTSERAGNLAEELAGARELIEQLRGQLERAKQETAHTAADRDRLTAELADQRRLAGQHQDAAAQARTELATVTAQLQAARDRIEAEKTHATERLADQRQRAEDAEQNAEALRADLAELRTRSTEELVALRRQLAEATQAAANRPGRGARTGTKEK